MLVAEMSLEGLLRILKASTLCTYCCRRRLPWRWHDMRCQHLQQPAAAIVGLVQACERPALHMLCGLLSAAAWQVAARRRDTLPTHAMPPLLCTLRVPFAQPECQGEQPCGTCGQCKNGRCQERNPNSLCTSSKSGTLLLLLLLLLSLAQAHTLAPPQAATCQPRAPLLLLLLLLLVQTAAASPTWCASRGPAPTGPNPRLGGARCAALF